MKFDENKAILTRRIMRLDKGKLKIYGTNMKAKMNRRPHGRRGAWIAVALAVSTNPPRQD